MAAIVCRVGMGSDVGHIRAVLREIFESAAIRRNVEMLICGSDIRNREAVICFKKLIGSIDLADADLVAAFHELWVGLEDERAHTQLLSKVGYEFWPQNAAEFLCRFIAERTGASEISTPSSRQREPVQKPANPRSNRRLGVGSRANGDDRSLWHRRGRPAWPPWHIGNH